MIKQYLDRFKNTIASDAALPWFYGVYAVVFLLYAIARIWNYIDYTANTDPAWLTEASPSARYILLVIPVACLAFFAVATLIIRAKSKNRDALGRAHCRYMLQTVWLIVGFWLLELFLYWTPLALITWVFAMPLRLACTGFYVLAFARSVWGWRQYLRGKYPTSRDLPLHKTRGVKWLLLSFPALLLLNWLVTTGSRNVQEYFSKPGNTHTITIVTHGLSKDAPKKLLLSYEMKNPGPGCLSHDPFTGQWVGPTNIKYTRVRGPDVVTEHEQVFRFSFDEMRPGYCDWRFRGAYILDGAQLAKATNDPRFLDSAYAGYAPTGPSASSFMWFGKYDFAGLPYGEKGARIKNWIHGSNWAHESNLAKTTVESPTSIRHEFLLSKDGAYCSRLPFDAWVCE